MLGAINILNIYFKESYKSVLTELSDKDFYIFGNTHYANMFYLYCKENQIEKNIKAFILSDMKKDKRAIHLIHGISVKDINWLEKSDKNCDIFVAGREVTVREQLIPLLQNHLNGNLYYVSDFVYLIMYCRSMHLAYENIVNRFVTSQSIYENGWINIKDIGSNQYYKYLPRVVQGDLPDQRIFDYKLDELYQNQLGDYYYFQSSNEKSVNPYKCRIYMAKSHVDRSLSEEFDTPFTAVIQVGAALTNQEIAVLKDNTGMNISERNRDYCEMSAIYWAWKNDKESDYLGFCHYRRRFVVDEAIINEMMNQRYEAIYTIPKLTDGGMREEFVERNYFLTPKVWDLIKEAIKKLSPEYLDPWRDFEHSFFILPCNMFIMRRDVFDQYCTWAFSILEEVDSYYLRQGIQCNNRYLGYISECLSTVYVMKHKETLKKGFVELKLLDSK